MLAPNKSLAAQLANEFREFSEQCVEYFVSYYDYYQPEAYMPASDTYIEKDSSINDEIDGFAIPQLRHCWPREPVVPSVSAIYGLGPLMLFGTCFVSGWGRRIINERSSGPH